MTKKRNKKTMFSYLYGLPATDFTKLMMAQKDTVDEETFSNDLRISLAQKRLECQFLIRDMTNHPGWAILEELLYDRVRDLDNHWASDVIDGKTKDLLAAAGLREGIVELISNVDGVNDSIDFETSLIESLNEQPQADPVGEPGQADPAPTSEEIS